MLVVAGIREQRRVSVDDDQVRRAITEGFLDLGYAPSLAGLSIQLGAGEDELGEAMERLARAGSLVLRPGAREVWMAPPFANAPTLFWVSSARGSWWAGCAWCALGIASLSDGDLEIDSRLGGEAENIELARRGGSWQPGDLVVHFAVPAADWGKSLVYACSQILLHRDRAAVDRWCDAHDTTPGAVLPLSQASRFARLWFGDALVPGWSRRSRADIRAIFDDAGLDGAFWSI